MMEKIASDARIATKEEQTLNSLQGVSLKGASLQPARDSSVVFSKGCRCVSTPIQEQAQLWAKSDMLVSGVREDSVLRGTRAIEVVSLSEKQPRQISMLVDGQWVESVTESCGSLKGLCFELYTPLFRNGTHQIEFEVFRHAQDNSLTETGSSAIARCFNVNFDNDLWLNSWPKAVNGPLTLDIGSKYTNAQCCISLTDQNGQLITQKTSTLNATNEGEGQLRFVEKAERFGSSTAYIDVRIEVVSAQGSAHLPLRLPVVHG